MIGALAPWFGSNRLLAKHVGESLVDCKKWIGVPFAGGMAELKYLNALTINVNDLHRHVINLAAVLGDDRLAPKVYRRLRRVLFHPEVLAKAQLDCRIMEKWPEADQPSMLVEWATSYFIAAWMPRHGTSGTKGEFDTGMSVRWSATGGDSAKHYWNAVASIRDWRAILRRCNFTTLDGFAFLDECQERDRAGHGLYCDPPFPGPGDAYTFNCGKTEAEVAAWHTRLRDSLVRFEHCKVACRFYDHPLVRDLYPERRWTWQFLDGRKQTNDKAPEVLLTNRVKP